MDLAETVEPKSDQLNADDLISGPRTFTVERVSKGSTEQPVNIHLAEIPGRPYRPSKSMRRVMIALWGKESSTYAGRRLTLYRDPKVRFGPDEVGGIKISHLSHITKREDVLLTTKRGRRDKHPVEPLPDTPVEPTAEQVAACADAEALKAMWRASSAERRAQIEARVAELAKTDDHARAVAAQDGAS